MCVCVCVVVCVCVCVCVCTTQGLYQKAETMYAMGDFEYALVFYHRGDKIRPDIKAFTLGIQKAQEAINNSIGCKNCVYF